MPNPAPTAHEIIEAAAVFYERFELMFHLDWTHTQACLADHMQKSFIGEGGTFIVPKVSDEGNNWSNREILLASYRKLGTLLHDLNKTQKQPWEKEPSASDKKMASMN